MARVRRHFGPETTNHAYTGIVRYAGAFAAAAGLAAAVDDPNQADGAHALAHLQKQFHATFGLRVDIDVEQGGMLVATRVPFDARPEAALSRLVAEGAVSVAERTRQRLARTGVLGRHGILVNDADLPDFAEAEQFRVALDTIAAAALQPPTGGPAELVERAETADLFLDAYGAPFDPGPDGRSPLRPHAGWGIGLGQARALPDAEQSPPNPAESARAQLRIGTEMSRPRESGRVHVQDRLTDALRLVTNARAAPVILGSSIDEAQETARNLDREARSELDEDTARTLPIGLIARATAVVAEDFHLGHVASLRPAPGVETIGPTDPLVAGRPSEEVGFRSYVMAPMARADTAPGIPVQRRPHLARSLADAAPWVEAATSADAYDRVFQEADTRTREAMAGHAARMTGQRNFGSAEVSEAGRRLVGQARDGLLGTVVVPSARGLGPLVQVANREVAQHQEARGGKQTDTSARKSQRRWRGRGAGHGKEQDR